MSNSVLAKVSLGCWIVWITLVAAVAELSIDILLFYGTKPLIMGSMLAYVLFAQPEHLPQRGWLLTAMLLALLGDVCLMIREIDLFLASTATFILMQACYIVMFVRDVRQSGRQMPPGRYVLVSLPIVGYLLVFLYILYPIINQDTVLWLAALLFALMLATLGVAGAVWQFVVAPHLFPSVFIGVILFNVAASAQAYYRFVKPQWTYLEVLILVSYALAQFFIIIGYLSAYDADDVTQQP